MVRSRRGYLAESAAVSAPGSIEIAETAIGDGVTGSPTEKSGLLMALALLYVLLACSLSVSSALPEVRRTIAMSDVVTSLHSSFFGWSLIIGGLFSARLFRRLGHGRVLAIATIAMTGGAVTFGVGHRVWTTLTGAAAFGAGAAAVVITIPAVVAVEFGERRNEVFTRLNAAPVFGGAMFTLSLAVAASHNLWRVPVIVVPVAVGFVTAVVGFRLRGSNIGAALQPSALQKGAVQTSAISAVRPISLPSVTDEHNTELNSENNTEHNIGQNTEHNIEPATVAKTGHSPLGLLRHNIDLRNRWLKLVVSITAEFGFGAWMVTFVREHGGFSSGQAPLVGVMWGGGMIISRTTTPRLVHALGRHVETTLFTLMAVGVAATILTPSVAGRLLSVGLTGFAVGPLYPLGIERLFIHSHGEDLTAVSSAGALASGVGATFGPLIVGFFSDHFGLPAAMWIPAALALFGAFATRPR